MLTKGGISTEKTDRERMDTAFPVVLMRLVLKKLSLSCGSRGAATCVSAAELSKPLHDLDAVLLQMVQEQYVVQIAGMWANTLLPSNIYRNVIGVDALFDHDHAPL